MPTTDYITKPLTKEAFRGRCDTAGRITVVIGVEFNDLMRAGGDDMDPFNDLVTERIVPKGVGGLGLMDLNYKVAGAVPEKNMVLVEVDADANAVLDEINESEDAD